MRAIVLAGGLGTRLRSVVSDVPKPMAPIAGRPFLEWLLDYWIAQGVTEVVLAVSYLNEKVRAHFGAAYRGVPIAWSIEETPLGTGGGLVQAWNATARDAPALVMNGDTFCEASAARLAEALTARHGDGVISVFEAPLDARYAAIETDEAGRILRFGDAPAAGRGYMNAGVYLLAPSFFADGPEPHAASLETDLLPAALAAGKRLYVQRSAGRFIDIGVPGDYARAPSVLAGTPGAS